MRTALVALTSLLAGCPSPLTQLVIVVDSDLEVPAELSSVRFEVRGPDGEMATATTDLRTASLPAFFSVVGGAELGPFDVRAVGVVGGADVVEQRAITSMVRGRSVVLPLTLRAVCREVGCPDEQTCVDGACEDARVPASALPRWRGAPPRTAGDAGACPGMEEVCNGEDDDCDGRIDETFDLSSDVRHCGRCQRECDLDGVVAECVDGECRVGSCASGLADCDGSAGNGCETDLRTTTDCGECGASCAAPMATTSCDTGSCVIDACTPGRADCDGDLGNGCEAAANTDEQCGACGRACPDGATCREGFCDGPNPDRDPRACGPSAEACADLEQCVGGECGCRPGFERLEGRPDAGCVDLSTDPEHCGSEDNRVSRCAGGRGVATCPAETTDCGGACVLVDHPSHCGRCDRACAVDQVCAGGACVAYRGVGECASCTGRWAVCCDRPGSPPICLEAGSPCPEAR